MFGTFEAERRREPLVYGLIDQVKSFNPFYLEVKEMNLKHWLIILIILYIIVLILVFLPWQSVRKNVFGEGIGQQIKSFVLWTRVVPRHTTVRKLRRPARSNQINIKWLYKIKLEWIPFVNRHLRGKNSQMQRLGWWLLACNFTLLFTSCFCLRATVTCLLTMV